MAYTPGVARVCRAIAAEPERAWSLTVKGNMVAVVSDGTGVLGLGDIGPGRGLPVMEGKALLFKELAGVDAVPLCISSQDVDGSVEFVRAAPAPTFGAINLEDIAAPRCFEIDVGCARVDIPVFHDDQHGTAIVVLAALLNALRVVGKRVQDARIVVTGAGAAGLASTNIILAEGATNVIVCDIVGALYDGRPGLDSERAALAERTNPGREQGMADELLAGADVYLEDASRCMRKLRAMASGAVVFAMANPTPEVQPEDVGDHVRIMATGRSDSEPDQQCARIPWCLPRCAGRSRDHDQRGDEARRGRGRSRQSSRTTSSMPSTSSRACSIATWRLRSRRRSRRRRRRVAPPDVLAASRRGDLRGRRVNERARVVRRLDSSGQIRIARRWFLPRRACGNNSSCSRSHTMKFLRTSSTSSAARRSDPAERHAGALQG